MTKQMEPFHRSLVALTKDSVKLREAVAVLTGQWKPDEFDAEILADLAERRARGEFAGGLGDG
ncbi:hypothetical protein [Nocardia sp. NPDC049149]|uniref:hypothetical protein n=1 Tax=Nocardia sp. NPDC049149 TaxID=3364315 RepID=UPI003714BF98